MVFLGISHGKNPEDAADSTATRGRQEAVGGTGVFVDDVNVMSTCLDECYECIEYTVYI